MRDGGIVSGRFVANNLGLLRVLAEPGLGIVVWHKVAREALNAGQSMPALQGWTLPPLPVSCWSVLNIRGRSGVAIPMPASSTAMRK